jgi:hypothetical protein
MFTVNSLFADCDRFRAAARPARWLLAAVDGRLRWLPEASTADATATRASG